MFAAWTARILQEAQLVHERSLHCGGQCMSSCGPACEDRMLWALASKCRMHAGLDVT